MKSVCSCSGYRKRTGQFRLPSASRCTFAPVALSEWNPSMDNSARPSDISSSSFEGSRTSLIFLSWRGGRKKPNPTKTQTVMVGRIRAKNQQPVKRQIVLFLLMSQLLNMPSKAFLQYQTQVTGLPSRIQNLSQTPRLLIKQRRRGGNPEKPAR